ncbi:FAD-dependent oxidoreductase [Candidatus Saccharibacteria bacterium]|nr:FAD-dependent oxidoreductase [Candidatus Saccharibacteria bacterium]
MAMHNTSVLILGGGFAGVKTARQLSKTPGINITLVSNDDTFRYGATIWRAATGFLKQDSYIPLKQLLPNNVELIQDSATSIDRSKKTVTLASKKTIKYDFCVIGLGVVTSYFGIKGLEEFSYSVKTHKEFKAFRQHLHQELIDEKSLDKNYVVVGAGPTGVELAAALKGYLKQVAIHHKVRSKKVNMELIEAAPRILPTLSSVASKRALRHLQKLGVSVRTKTTVKGETKNTINIGDKIIPTHTVIWTAGVTCNPFFINNPKQFALNQRKKVIVDGYLRVGDNTFVVGDSASTPYSGLALTALHNASYVAKYIQRTIQKKSVKPYRPLKPITIVPVGEGWSIFEWRKLVITGRLASIMRSIYDYVGYSKIMDSKKAFNIWLRRDERSEDCLFCKEL